MTEEYVLLYINDDDEESPMFLRAPGKGLTYKIGEAEHLPREEAEKATRVMDGNAGVTRETGVCFAVPVGYHAGNDEWKENKA